MIGDSSKSRPTCGPIYLEALTQYTSGDPDKVRLFAAGFVHGQAEKVYLGACHACMFRPSPVNAAMVRNLASDASKRYGLLLALSGDEIWLCRDHIALATVESLRMIDRDSSSWHVQRAWLCGVPPGETDVEFHKRHGYAEACDVTETSVDA